MSEDPDEIQLFLTKFVREDHWQSSKFKKKKNFYKQGKRERKRKKKEKIKGKSKKKFQFLVFWFSIINPTLSDIKFWLKMFSRKFRRLKWIHKSLPTAWALWPKFHQQIKKNLVSVFTRWLLKRSQYKRGSFKINHFRTEIPSRKF